MIKKLQKIAGIASLTRNNPAAASTEILINFISAEGHCIKDIQYNIYNVLKDS